MSRATAELRAMKQRLVNKIFDSYLKETIMNTGKSIHLVWENYYLIVKRVDGDATREIREFAEEQYPRAADLFVELVTDKCGGALKAPHPTVEERKDRNEVSETEKALIVAVGLLVRCVNETKLPDDLGDEVEDFVNEMAGQ